jgi:beta-galactosidase
MTSRWRKFHSINQLFTIGLLAFWAHSAVAAELPRQTRLLSTGWKFQAGEQAGAEAATFDDQGWRPVSVPHDWSIEGTRDRANSIRKEEFTQWVVWRKDGSQSYLPRGTGWYRLAFDQPALGVDQQALIYFEGVYRESDVWLNGKLLGRHPSGYTSFAYDLTQALKPGRNVLAVRCDAAMKEGWWFEACGIYRPVQLLIKDKLAVPTWGVWVSTPEITAAQAVARVRTTVRNDHMEPRQTVVSTRIVDAAGTEIGRAETTETVAAGQTREVTQEIVVTEPRLWSPDEPYLYRAFTEIGAGKKVVDATETTFGIRSFHFDPELGFFMNGKPTKLWGVANHMDVAALGGALPPRVSYESIRVLKGSGANFLRGAHNPRTPAELDAADRLGICVVAETRYFDNSEFGLNSLRDLILRDRNHPSIIIWSMGNEEEGKQGTPAGVAIAQDMIRVIRENDPYRATSIAQNRDFNKPCGFSDMFDVLGQNWRGLAEAAEDHRRFPKRAVYASEYNYNVGWDSYASWPWMSGGAVWAGFEYYGEFTWPQKTWPGQIADLCHEPLPGYHRARAQWGKLPTLWVDNTWSGKAGKSVSLEGFTNCEKVNAYVNGKLVKTVVKDLKVQPNDQLWTLRPIDDGAVLLVAADGRAVRSSDFKLVSADPADPAQQWTVLDQPDSTIAIKAGKPTGQGQFFNVNGSSQEDGKPVQLYAGRGDAENEQWKTEPQEGGKVRMVAKHSGLYLTLASSEGGLMQAASVAAGPTFVSTAAATLKIPLNFVPDSTVRLEGLIANKVVATQEITALGAPQRLLLETATPSLRNDGMDVALLRCGIADAQGNIIRSADRKVRITVTGEGTFAGSGNACRDLPKAMEIPVSSPVTSTFKGLCQFAVRVGQKPGVIIARVEADGLAPAELRIQVTPESDPAMVAAEPEGERLPVAAPNQEWLIREVALSATSIASGAPVEARLAVTNVSSAYPVEVAVDVDGQQVSSERFSVAIAAERTLTVPLPQFYAEGKRAVVVSLRRNAKEIENRRFTVEVKPTPVSFAAEALTVTPYVTEGGKVEVSATVRNMGSRKAEAAAVEVLLNGSAVATSPVTLLPGETAQIQATFKVPAGDRHEVSVAGEVATVSVLQPFKPGEGVEMVGAPSQVTGHKAKALKFSGANEFIKLVPPVDLKEKSFTLWMRCKLDALDAESNEAPLFSGGRTADQEGVRGGFHHDKIFFSVVGTRGKNLESLAQVVPGQWVDLAFVLDAKYMPKQTGPSGADLQAAFWTARARIYIDGKLQGERDSKVYLGDLSEIGALWGNPKTFNGAIEEVKVYTAALSLQQIEQLSSDPSAVKEKPALWLNY